MDTPSEGSTVGVVGPGDSVRDSLREAGLSVVEGSAEMVREAAPDWVVAVGASALTDLVTAGIDRPVLPVGAGEGVRSVPQEQVTAAIGSVDAGAGETESRTLLGVTVDDEQVATALLDVFLVTDEPARISEFTVDSAGDRVARFRADGTVVATPAGSVDYASDAGGPVLFPGTGSLSVVPVAPFVTDADHWVVDDAAMTVRIEREEPIALVVDGRKRRLVQEGDAVSIAATGQLPIMTVPESPPVRGRELEKH